MLYSARLLVYALRVCPETIRSAHIASLLARETQWSIGRLHREHDPEHPDEMPAGMPEDERGPLFVLSTEGEATDDHVVRQFWDLSRSIGVGTPILWNHNADVLLGQWQDHAVIGSPGTPGAMLTARGYFDPDDELAQKRRGQVRRGILRAVSVGWIPGDLVRRGSLREDDPMYRPQEDDECGQPMEGMVMGTRQRPNILVEASLTPTPADPRAVAIERNARAVEQLGGLARGERVSGVDLAGVLLALRDRPGVRAFARAILREELASPEGRALLRSLLDSPTSRSVRDIFPGVDHA